MTLKYMVDLPRIAQKVVTEPEVATENLVRSWVAFDWLCPGLGPQENFELLNSISCNVVHFSTHYDALYFHCFLQTLKMIKLN